MWSWDKKKPVITSTDTVDRSHNTFVCDCNCNFTVAIETRVETDIRIIQIIFKEVRSMLIVYYAYFSQVFKTDTLPSQFIKFKNFITINYQLVKVFTCTLYKRNFDVSWKNVYIQCSVKNKTVYTLYKDISQNKKKSIYQTVQSYCLSRDCPKTDAHRL